jgi:hypothetical protein
LQNGHFMCRSGAYYTSLLTGLSLRVTPQCCCAVQSESNFNRVIANGVKQSLDCRNLIFAPELGLVRQSSPRRPSFLGASLRVTPQCCGAVQSESNFYRVIANGVKQSLDCRNLILAPELGLVRQSSPRRPSFLGAVFAKQSHALQRKGLRQSGIASSQSMP